jgi:hypothetical protein
MSEPYRTVIWGSCVARDVLRVVPRPFTLNDYIARQCWLSAHSRSVPVPDLSTISSRFQVRALEGDFRSSAMGRIEHHAPATDLLLIDLASDRHGAVAVGDGYVSLTPEHRRAFGGMMPGGKRIPFGSDKHFSAFRRAAAGIRDAIVSAGLWDQTFVLRFRFTDRTINGDPVPPERTTPAEDNARIEPYYDVLERLGYQFSVLPDELGASTHDHAWGAGSDHFVDEAYQWWADDVTSRAAHHRNELSA